MKKLLTIILLGISLTLPIVAFAQPAPATAPTAAPATTTAPTTTPETPEDPCKNAVDDIEKAACKQISDIFKIEKVKGTEALQTLTSAVSSKRESTFSDFFASLINILTGVAVVMTFVGLVVAGGYFVFSEGEESRITKARTIIIYVIVGDLIIAASYAIVKGITLIKPLS